MKTREERCGVSQSISVFFFFLKPRSVFSKWRRPLEREKSPLNTRRTNLLLERRLMIFARRNGRLNKRRSSRERTKTKDGNFFRSFLLSNRSGGRLDGQTARDDVSGENCIVVGEDDASARIMKWKDMIWKVHLRGFLEARRRAYVHLVVLSGTYGTHVREGGELESCFSTRNRRKFFSHSEKLFYVLIKNDDRRDKVQLNFFFFPFFPRTP